MILCSASLAAVFLIIFIVNAKKGQFEDDESPAVRILFDSGEIKEKKNNGNKKDEEKKEENNKIEEKSE